MKYIKKVAVSPIPEINGSVVDSFNVEDKITNAPSVRAVEEYVDGTVLFGGSATSDITLNDSITNYKYIEILHRFGGREFSTGKLYNNYQNKLRTVLTGSLFDTGYTGATESLYHFTQEVLLQETALTIKYVKYYIIKTGTVVSGNYDQAFITQIIGYKKQQIKTT